MRLKILARIAYNHIKDGTFTFDTPLRRREAMRVIYGILFNKPDIDPSTLEDPILEFHIGVYIPNFDYPLIPVNSDNEPIVWNKKHNSFVVPGNGTHMFRGVGISGEYYYVGFLKSLNAFRECPIKVDRYTSEELAAFAFVCTMTRVIDKDYAIDHMVEDYPLKPEYEVLLEHWMDFTKSTDVKEFEATQKKLYIKWLQKWIMTHGKQPISHMRSLKWMRQKNSLDLSENPV